MSVLPNPFVTESSTSIGGLQEAPAAAQRDQAAAGLLPDECRFVLDEAAFMEAIEPPPLFLQVPSAVTKILAWR